MVKEPKDVFTEALKQRLNQIAAKAEEQAVKDSVSSPYSNKDRELFARLKAEEDERQAREDRKEEDNRKMAVAEEVKQPITPVNTNVPPINFPPIQFDDKGRPIAPPLPPPASDHKPNNPTLQRSVASNGQDNTENRSTKNSPPPKRFGIADEKTLQEVRDKIRQGGVKRVISPIPQEEIDRRTAEMQARHPSSPSRKR